MIEQLGAVDDKHKHKGNSVGRPKKPKGEESTKIQVTLPHNLAVKLDKLQADTHASSLPDFVRNALTFYAAAINQHKKGGKILFRDEDGLDRELAIFI